MALRAHADVRSGHFADRRASARAALQLWFLRWWSAAAASVLGTLGSPAVASLPPPPDSALASVSARLADLRLAEVIRAPVLRIAARCAAKVVRRDRLVWLRSQAHAVEAAASRGSLRPLWRLVRRLSGRSAHRGPRPLPIVLGPDGQPLGSPQAVAAMWEAHFSAEFPGRPLVRDWLPGDAPAAFPAAPPCAAPLSSPLHRHPDLDGSPSLGMPASAEEWAHALASVAGTFRSESAIRPDGLPPELLVIAGPSLLRSLG